jgi:hypothetical protein
MTNDGGDGGAAPTVASVTATSTNVILPIDFEKTGAYYTARLTLKEAMCAGCYANLIDDLQTDYFRNFYGGPAQSLVTNGPLMTACLDDPDSEVCAGSQFIAGNLNDFKTCTGYSVDFKGPVCTLSQMTSVQKHMDPIPYHLFIDCAINASANNSATCGSRVLTQYWDKLESLVGSHCNSCFTEFYDAVTARANDADVQTACVSDQLTSAGCQTALADEIASFKVCAGFDIQFAISDDTTGNDTTGDGTTTDNKSSSNLISSLT